MGSFTTTVAVQPFNVQGNGACFNYAPPGFPIENTNGPATQLEQVNLVAGNNTIPVPAGTMTVTMSPPSNSTNAKTLKGASGDAGFAISANQPSIISIANGTASIIIGSAGSETVQLFFA